MPVPSKRLHQPGLVAAGEPDERGVLDRLDRLGRLRRVADDRLADARLRPRLRPRSRRFRRASDACGKMTTRALRPPAVSTARFTMSVGRAVAADDEQVTFRRRCRRGGRLPAGRAARRRRRARRTTTTGEAWTHLLGWRASVAQAPLAARGGTLGGSRTGGGMVQQRSELDAPGSRTATGGGARGTLARRRGAGAPGPQAAAGLAARAVARPRRGRPPRCCCCSLRTAKCGWSLTVRSSRLPNHAGQVSLPGGAVDAGETIEAGGASRGARGNRRGAGAACACSAA